MTWEDFKISYSRINAYLFCPYKYKLVYTENIHIPVNPDITFGHIIHAALEKYHSKNAKTLEELAECYDESWKNDGFEDPRDIFEYYERGRIMLENYYKSFEKSETEILYTEKSFDANIGKYRFIGIIDRIDKYPDGKYEVMDYKTHAKVWERERVDKDLQLTLYAYACKNIFGFNPDKISVYFLSENKKIYTQRTKEQIENAVNLCLDTAGKIASESFDPDVSKCAACDFKKKCKFSSCLG